MPSECCRKGGRANRAVTTVADGERPGTSPGPLCRRTRRNPDVLIGDSGGIELVKIRRRPLIGPWTLREDDQRECFARFWPFCWRVSV